MLLLSLIVWGIIIDVEAANITTNMKNEFIANLEGEHCEIEELEEFYEE